MARPVLKARERGEISVSSLDTGGFEARCRVRGLDGRIRQVSRTGRTKGIARARLQEALEKVVTGRPDHPMSHYLQIWLQGREQAGLAANTLDAYRISVEMLNAKIGGVEPAQLTPAQLQQTIDSMPRGRARTSLTALRGAVRAAAMDRALTTDPLLGVVLEPARERVKPKALTVSEFQKMRAHVAMWDPPHNVADPRFLQILDWIAATGCRTGEALGVHGEHVRAVTFPDGTVRRVWAVAGTVIDGRRGSGAWFQPHTKAHDLRVIVLPDGFLPALPLTGLAFPSRAGTLRSPASFRKQWHRRLDGTEWEWVVPKTIRKTVATLLARTLSADAARMMLGHSDEAVTLRHYIEPEVVPVDFRKELQGLRPSAGEQTGRFQSAG